MFADASASSQKKILCGSSVLRVFLNSNGDGKPSFYNGSGKGAESAGNDSSSNHKESGIKDTLDGLTGTTLRVYKFLYRKGKPMGIHDVQKGLKLSSPSVSSYHLKKLLQAGLIRESNYGYVVDRIVFENTIRLGRARIPFKSSFAIFFGLTLFILLTLLRPQAITSMYLFALGVSGAAFAYSLYETILVLRQIY